MSSLFYLLICATLMPALCQFILLINTQSAHLLTRQLAMNERASVLAIIQQDMIHNLVTSESKSPVRYNVTPKGLKRSDPQIRYVTDTLTVTQFRLPDDNYPCLDLHFSQAAPLRVCTPEHR
ncbi:hypothetical protein OAJ27_00125 [bacterium]|nr:hypothetical protein [bacterium]